MNPQFFICIPQTNLWNLSISYSLWSERQLSKLFYWSFLSFSWPKNQRKSRNSAVESCPIRKRWGSITWQAQTICCPASQFKTDLDMLPTTQSVQIMSSTHTFVIRQSNAAFISRPERQCSIICEYSSYRWCSDTIAAETNFLAVEIT